MYYEIPYETFSGICNSLEYGNNDQVVYYFIPNAWDKLNLMEYILYFGSFKDNL